MERAWLICGAIRLCQTVHCSQRVYPTSLTPPLAYGYELLATNDVQHVGCGQAVNTTVVGRRLNKWCYTATHLPNGTEDPRHEELVV